MQKDGLITAALSTVTSVWVSDACYKRYTRQRNVNKTVSVGDQPNQPFERRRRSAPFVYQTHCLVPGVVKYQISEVSTIIRKTGKYKLYNTLK